jgi:hypothetical protein
MTTTTYNGWTNYETWKHNLEFVNQDYWREVFSDEAIEASGVECAYDAVMYLASALEDDLNEYIESIGVEGYAVSVLNANASEINFYEIAKHILED